MKARTVVWRDAYALGENWIPAKGHRFGRPIIVTTHGYIVNGPKGYTVVADSTYVDSDGERWFGGVTVIPNGMVISCR